MTGYSPISTRNHRVNTMPSTTTNPLISTTAATITAASNATGSGGGGGSRRRESLNSSIGATSIRRLLAVNRGCRHKIPVHIRAKVARNFTFLILAHGLMCAVLVPLFGLQVSIHQTAHPSHPIPMPRSDSDIFHFDLQASNSVWFHQEKWLLRMMGPNVGPLLLSFCCLVTSGTCLLTARLVKRIGYVSVIAAHYVTLCAFLFAHLFPSIWLLLPAYVLLGMTLGPAWICKWSLVVFYASRISCGQHECSSTTAMPNDGGPNAIRDESKVFCNRNERVRRLARWFHAVQDIGIFVGALIASIIISCAATQSGCFYTNKIFKFGGRVSGNSNGSGSIRTTETDIILLHSLNKFAATGIERSSDLNKTNFLVNELAFSKPVNNATDSSHTSQLSSPPATMDASLTTKPNILKFYQDTIIMQHDDLLDSLYNTNERGIRICGAGSCPTWNFKSFDGNITEEYNWFTYSGTIPMTLFYFMLALVALTLSCLSQPVDNALKFENVKRFKDTLVCAGPMAYFIGTEQGYVLGGFTRVSLHFTIQLIIHCQAI